MNKALNLLKYSLSVVYIWFGALKIYGVSPVADLVHQTYPWMPEKSFLMFLGVWEVVIGLLLLHKKTVLWAIVLMWIQLAGIFAGLIIHSELYFQGSILTINLYGEFVVKNLVLLAASYVIWLQSRIHY